MIAFHCWGICKHSDDQIWVSYMYGENIWKGKEHGNKGTFEKVATSNKGKQVLLLEKHYIPQFFT